MAWSNDVAYFFGGAFLTNAIPHLVSGLQGRPFQSPFAKPRGIGLSSSTVNFNWGAFNAAVAYALVCRVGEFDARNAADVSSFAAGALALGTFCARHFGKLHGGIDPT